MQTLTASEAYVILSARASTPALDPATISLRQLAAIRGAMWTVRGPWRFGPRPGQPTNMTALEYIYSYGDPYHNRALGGAFNLNDEQRAMMEAYCSQGYTHCCFGPVTAQSYHGEYPDFLFDDPTTFEAWLDWLQMFWDHEVIPICFLHPDNWNLDQTRALYDPLIANNPRAQRLMRVIVPAGWEPAYYNWSAATWASYQQWAHALLPNALILLHTVPDVDAPGGTDDAGDDNGRGNDKVWWDVAPYIHGWLHQASSFEDPWTHGDPNHPENSNYDNWAALFDATDEKSFYNRFHHGYAGWPTVSLWGDEPIYLYSGEFCSYWNYHDDRPYEEGVGWGDRSVLVGADGYLDSGADAVLERAETYTRMAPLVAAPGPNVVAAINRTRFHLRPRARRGIRPGSRHA